MTPSKRFSTWLIRILSTSNHLEGPHLSTIIIQLTIALTGLRQRIRRCCAEKFCDGSPFSDQAIVLQFSDRGVLIVQLNYIVKCCIFNFSMLSLLNEDSNCYWKCVANSPLWYPCNVYDCQAKGIVWPPSWEAFCIYRTESLRYASIVGKGCSTE